MIMKSLIPLAIFLFMATKVYGQKQNTTPVPILRQINRHNEDGSYSYGYEGADGQFKIETKYKNGDVKGKYGYVDLETGNLREVEYGADRNGFNPSGTDINIPPPTIADNTYPQLGPNEEDDGQYREDPSIYHKDSRYNSNSAEKPSRPAPIQYTRPAPIQPAYSRPAPTESPVPSNEYYQSRFQSPQQPRYQAPVQQRRYQEPVEPQQQPYYQPYRAPQQNYYQQQNEARNHPALSQFDINSGSYTLNYGR